MTQKPSKPFTIVYCSECGSMMEENIPNDPKFWQTGYHCHCGYGFVLPWVNNRDTGKKIGEIVCQ